MSKEGLHALATFLARGDLGMTENCSVKNAKVFGEKKDFWGALDAIAGSFSTQCPFDMCQSQ